ncbi:hypothetical protein CEP54_014771 [Fusarium duplospermum]|uniref:Uncharacterized protein n=1 Tax=Fusarium duplospermum TaxID=1325734 RepID=A0A428NTV7_9HYPO|nr:hypothetical protein CEP54_014771 [Fusarium duplospermum]
MNNVMQLANGSFRPPQLHLVLEFLVGLAVLFKGVGICPKQDGPGNEINDMPAAPKPAVLLVEAKLSSELVKTCVVAFRVVFTTMAALDLRQAEQERAKLPFVVKKVYVNGREASQLLASTGVSSSTTQSRLDFHPPTFPLYIALLQYTDTCLPTRERGRALSDTAV